MAAKIFNQSDLPFTLCFVLILLFYLLSTMAIAAVDDDFAAMAMLANTIQPTPPNWSSDSSDYCKWSGVQCDSQTNRVSSISLTSMSITTVPSDFPSLPQLNTLDLSRNSLSGSFPSLANLTSLQELYLEKNNFTSIPLNFFNELPTSLTLLTLSDNPFLLSWTIPNELTRFSNLKTFFCDSANLTGQIPDIFHLIPMETLSLSQNYLYGPLPPSLGMSHIKNMWIHDQMLNGSIDVLSEMTNLVIVAVYGNQLTGPISEFSNCRYLEELHLDNNLLTGVVPASLALQPSLKFVNLTSNKLQGPYPSSLKNKLNAGLDDNNFCTDTGGPCDPQVETLLEIAADLGFPLRLSESWTGNDSCNNWPFIICDSEKRINTVNFGNQQFGGTISPAFAYLFGLQYLYLNDNNLTGPIPDSLTTLTNLLVIDVSNNNLSGHIPVFRPSVRLNVAGNPLLLTGNRSVTKGLIVKIASSLGAIIGVICAFLLGKRIAKHETGKQSREVFDEGQSHSTFLDHDVFQRNKSKVGLQELQSLSIQEIVIATNNFHDTNKLGQGGFGPVYKGILPDGQEIAVKRLSRASEQGLEEFMNEVEVISKLQHRNLVKLVGYCTEGQEKVLIYEYMPNKSLDAFLFDPQRQPVLNWRKRFNIIESIGRGLQYLHWDSGLRIIHRDLKPSNILLDKDLNPKISDFGMARIFRSNADQANTKRVVGTYGYMPPEYAMEGQYSEKSDVFSFGVLLLEIISGRENTSFYNDQQDLSLLARAWRLWNEENTFALVDSTILHDQSFYGEILRCIHVGMLCVQNFMGDRPNMSTIVAMLSGEIENLPSPKQTAFIDKIISMDEEDSFSTEKQFFSTENVSVKNVDTR